MRPSREGVKRAAGLLCGGLLIGALCCVDNPHFMAFQPRTNLSDKIYVHGPTGIALCARDDFIVADLQGLRKFKANLECIAEVTQNPVHLSDKLSDTLPLSAVEGDEVLVVERQRGCVLRFSDDLVFKSAVGKQGSGPGEFKIPMGAALISNGSFFVSDSGNHRIQKFSPDGRWLLSWGDKGPGVLQNPLGICVDNDHSELYVTDCNHNRIVVYDFDGNKQRHWGGLGTVQGDDRKPGLFNSPQQIVYSDGMVFVLDAGNGRVQEFDRWGAFLGEIVLPSREERRDTNVLAVRKNQSLYVADYLNSEILFYRWSIGPAWMVMRLIAWILLSILLFVRFIYHPVVLAGACFHAPVIAKKIIRHAMVVIVMSCVLFVVFRWATCIYSLWSYPFLLGCVLWMSPELCWAYHKVRQKRFVDA